MKIFIFFVLAVSVSAKLRSKSLVELALKGGDHNKPKDITFTAVSVADEDELRAKITQGKNELEKDNGYEVTFTGANTCLAGKIIYIWKEISKESFQVGVKDAVHVIGFSQNLQGSINQVSLTQIYAIDGCNLDKLKALAMLYVKAFMTIPCSKNDRVILTDACVMKDLDDSKCSSYYAIKKGRPAYGWTLDNTDGTAIFQGYPLLRNGDSLSTKHSAMFTAAHALASKKMSEIKDVVGFSACQSSSDVLVSDGIADINALNKAFFLCMLQATSKEYLTGYSKDHDQKFTCIAPRD